MAEGLAIQTLLASAIPMVITGAWTYWTWHKSRQDNSVDKIAAAEKAKQQEQDRVRERMEAAQVALWDRQEKRAREQDERIEELEKDRERGWELARSWHAKCHDIRHLYADAFQKANGRLERAKLETVEFPRIILPSLERITEEPS